MKTLIAAVFVFCAGLFIFAGKAYCEGLTEQEEKIYYDYWEAYAQSFDSDGAEKSTAQKYGITLEDLKSINERGIHRPITDQEKSILDEQDRLVKAEKDISKVMSNIRQKYGLSEGRMQELLFRETTQSVEKMWDSTHSTQ